MPDMFNLLIFVTGTFTAASFALTLLLLLLAPAGFRPTGRLRSAILFFLLAQRFPRATP